VELATLEHVTEEGDRRKRKKEKRLLAKQKGNKDKNRGRIRENNIP